MNFAFFFIIIIIINSRQENQKNKNTFNSNVDRRIFFLPSVKYFSCLKVSKIQQKMLSKMRRIRELSWISLLKIPSGWMRKKSTDHEIFIFHFISFTTLLYNFWHQRLHLIFSSLSVFMTILSLSWGFMIFFSFYHSFRESWEYKKCEKNWWMWNNQNDTKIYSKLKFLGILLENDELTLI